MKPTLELREDDRYYFDAEAAERPVRFIETFCVHYQGRHAGKPFLLEPWQKQIIRDLFGWKRRSDGRRRFKRAYIEIAKGSGKSPLAAAIGLYALCGDGVPGAEVYACATETKQADIVFSHAKEMARRSPRLRNALFVRKYAIAHHKSSSTFQVLSGDPYGKHGIKPTLIIFDELHEQQTRDLWDALASAAIKRENCLMMAITNAGVDRESICYEQRRHAERVLRGESEDETFYPVLYNAPEDADWTIPASWRLANPSLGTTILVEDLQTECTAAIEEPALQPRFRRFYLSQWVQAATRWLDHDVWKRNAREIDEAKLLGRKCIVGVDASRYYDMTAVVAVFLATPEEPACILPRFFMPRPTVERRTRAESTPFQQWAEQRLIDQVDGPAIDDDTIVGAVQEMADRFQVLEVAFDPKSMTGSVQRMEAQGMVTVPVGQGFNLSDAAKAFHRRLLEGRMHHPGNAVLDWCAANVEVMSDREDHIRLVKPQDRTKNIDGISAAVTAMKRAALLESAAPEPTPQFVVL